MPIYEYQCAACQHHFDALQKISDPILTTCPQCHKESLTKLMSSTSFHLKGTGWYQTDYKSTKPAANTGETVKKDHIDTTPSADKKAKSKDSDNAS